MDLATRATQPPIQAPTAWTDIQGLTGLAGASRTDSKAALPAVARQFEALFAQMMIKSMRSASFGDGIMDSQQGDQWRDLFDNQIALSMANDGKGLGIATMLVRQLGGDAQPTATGTTVPTTLTPAQRAAIPLPGGGTGVPATTAAGSGAPPSPPAGASGNPDGVGSVINRALDFAKSAGSSVLQAAKQWAFSGPDDFVQKLAPYAQAVATKLGVSMRAVLAQAALETGWGQHMPTQPDGQSSNNLFGIKAGTSWRGRSVNVPTVEYKGGVAVSGNASFRAYAGPMRSFADYTRVLTGNPRYAAALGRGNDVAGFAQALHQAGYATDPNYAAKLTAVANSDAMRSALDSLKNSASGPTVDL